MVISVICLQQEMTSVIVQGEIICSVFFEETHMMGLERTKSHIIYIYIRKDITSKKKHVFSDLTHKDQISNFQRNEQMELPGMLGN